MKLPSLRLFFLLIVATSAGPGSLNAQVDASAGNTPYGLAGSYGGSINTGAGTFDPLERNFSRSVTDLVVPGAVIPFTYTRIWNSRHPGDPGAFENNWMDGNWSDGAGHHWNANTGTNWSWSVEGWQACMCSDQGTTWGNDWFYGYYVNFPDGRRVQFAKPQTAGGAPGAAGVYRSNQGGVVEYLVIDADQAHSHVYLGDGSVVNFGGLGSEGAFFPTTIVDPHGLVTTFTLGPSGMDITEPGGRSIHVNALVYSTDNKTVTTSVTTSLGQSVNYVAKFAVSGSGPGMGGELDNPNVLASTLDVIYNDVIDPATNQPVQANYIYKQVEPLNTGPGASNMPPKPYFYRLVWASDPMFDGPVKKVKYIYVDGTYSTLGDTNLTAVREVRYCTDYYNDPGVLLSRVEMQPYTTDPTTYVRTSGYYERKETRGDGATRIISYYNADPSKMILPKVDHVTDFADSTLVESYAYGTGSDYSRIPVKTTDMRQHVTSRILEPVLGKLTRETHVSDGSYKTWAYTDPAKPYYLASTTDELGNPTSYTRPDPANHLVTRIDYPGGSFETFQYNSAYYSFGRVTDHQLASGTWEHHRYDVRGLLQQEWNDVDGYAARNEYTYWQVGEQGGVPDMVKTTQDGVARRDGAAYTTKTYYNGRHQVTEVHYRPTTFSPDPDVTYGYDLWGNRTSSTDELGHTTSTIYDEFGRPTSVVEPLNAPSWNGTGTMPSRTTRWTYERVRDGVTYAANTHVSKQWRTQTEPIFNATSERRVTVRDYDENDRLVNEQTGWIQQSSGAVVQSADYESHSFHYDADGNRDSYTDPQGRITTYYSDERERLKTTTAPLNRVTQNWYDVANNKTDVQFPDGTWNKWRQFDGFGQAWQFFDERNNVTDFTYDWGPMKKLNTVTTHRVRDDGTTENELTDFDADLLGRPSWTHFPDGTSELTSYVLGLVDAFKTRKNETKRLHYDAREREDYETWDSEAAPRIDRQWDDASRLTKIWNKFSTVDYTYDDAGQVWKEGNAIAGSGPNGTAARVQIVYKRYPDGQPAHVTYPQGWVSRRDYTARGQLKTVGWDDAAGNWTQKAIDYTYRDDGDVDYQVYGNGTQTSFGYDARGFISSVQHQRVSVSPAQTYSQRDYWRDNRDRIYAWERGSDATNNPRENGKGERYEYDAEGQLTRAYYGVPDPQNSATGYTLDDNFNGFDAGGVARGYDALGNRQGNNYQNSAGWMSYTRRDTGLNQYLKFGVATATYDTQYYNAPGNGVLMQDNWITASYNALNQPVAISSPSLPAGQFTWFGYDPLGRCVKRWVNATGAETTNPATYFYYDGWNLVQEGPAAATADWIYFHGARVDELVASHQFSTNFWNYYHYDARGHVSLLTDQTGALVEQYDYRAFGEPLFFNGAGVSIAGTARGNRFLFTGREWMKELKLYDYRHRMYQPVLGRFLQPDPEQFKAGDYNLYRYCHNDPINGSDPMGLMTGDDNAAEARERAIGQGAVDVSSDSGLQSMSRQQKVDSGNYSAGGGGMLNSGGGATSLTMAYGQPGEAGQKGQSFEQRGHQSAVKMLAEMTHKKPPESQSGLITDGPPGSVGPKGAQMEHERPFDLTSKRVERERLPAGRGHQEVIGVHYHHRGGPYGVFSDVDQAAVKNYRMYFTNHDSAVLGRYYIYPKGGATPQQYYDPRIKPDY